MNKQLWLVLLCSLWITSIYSMNAYADNNENKVFNMINNAVYEVYAIDKDKQTNVMIGSAVAVTKHLLATNCHVALAGNFLVIKVNNQPYLARLCYFNQADDLCMIDIAGMTFTPVNIRPTQTVTIGEEVYALGSPEGHAKTISQGIITKIVLLNKKTFIQTNALMTYGSSGGGLFDKNGNLIGITTGGIPKTDVGYAIPTELISDVIQPSKQSSCQVPPSATVMNK